MVKLKFLLLLISLPLLAHSKRVRQKHVENFDVDQDQSPNLDHLNLEDSWKAPSRVISATYSGDAESGRVNHANLLINIVPRMNKKPVDVDLIASQSLANAKTAEEYVSKALDLKNKYDHTTPSSSFVKYDIYENQETKHVPSTVIKAVTARPVVAQTKDDYDIGDAEKSSSDYHEFYQKPDYSLKTTTTTTYRSPEEAQAFKDLESSHTHLTSHFDPYANTIMHQSKVGYPSKEEVYDYIERAVKKYIHELETEGKLTTSGVTAINGAPSTHTETKTYYRFPSSTPAPVTTTKLYSMGTHSEFFKPAKSTHLKATYATVKPMIVESFTPEAIDLTVNTKKRPKPIDLSALDVGQSWNHGSDPIVATTTYRKSVKPKFNSQTYHDINALPYIPNRGLVYDDGSQSTSSLYVPETSYRDHSVGSSISFGGHRGTGVEDSDDSNKYASSIQVINGVPVSNPYKFSAETLNDIFDNSGSKQTSGSANSEYASNWSPYENGNYRDYQQDTYNPRYNSNPEGHGYQDNYRYSSSVSDWDSGEYIQRPRHGGSSGGDMYTSGSSTRPKKLLPSSHSVHNSHSKHSPKPYRKSKSKQRSSKRYSTHKFSRDLERDLTPPPAKY